MTLSVTMTPMAKSISKVTEVKSGQDQKRCVLIKVIGEKGHKMGPLCETSNPTAANNGQPAQAAHEPVLNKIITQVNSTWLPHWLIVYSKKPPLLTEPHCYLLYTFIHTFHVSLLLKLYLTKLILRYRFFSDAAKISSVFSSLVYVRIIKIALKDIYCYKGFYSMSNSWLLFTST